MPLSDALNPWHSFYELIGAASATMIGLLFVAASISFGVFSPDRRAAPRLFLSASVVNFGLVLATCLIALTPVQSWRLLGGLIAAGGVFGLAHTALACRDAVQDGMLRRMAMDDRVWYLAMPSLGYALLTVSAIALAAQSLVACVALAVAMGFLLLIGIHNAWDITVWAMTRRRG